MQNLNLVRLFNTISSVDLPSLLADRGSYIVEGYACGSSLEHCQGIGCVGTLKTGYLHIQALSQDKEHGVHPHAAMQAIASDHTSLQRWALELPCVPWPRTSPPC
jgi:hypothetical protein